MCQKSLDVVIGSRRAHRHNVLMLRITRRALHRQPGSKTQANAVRPAGINDLLHAWVVLALRDQHVVNRASAHGLHDSMNAVNHLELFASLPM